MAKKQKQPIETIADATSVFAKKEDIVALRLCVTPPPALREHPNPPLQAITTDAELQTAIDWMSGVKKLIKTIEEFFKPLKRDAKTAHTNVCNKEKELLAPLEKAVDAMNAVAAKYQTDKLAAQQKQQRDEQAAAQLAAGNDREKLLAQADIAERKGNTVLAQSLKMQADEITAAPISKFAPVGKPSGASLRTMYKVDESLLDESALIVAAASQPHLRRYLTASISALEADKNANEKMEVPGVVFVTESKFAVRTK